MRHVLQRGVKQRQPVLHQLRLLDGPLPSDRSDRQSAAASADMVELLQPVDINQDGRRASRMFSSGMRLCPPAISLASPSCCLSQARRLPAPTLAPRSQKAAVSFGHTPGLWVDMNGTQFRYHISNVDNRLFCGRSGLRPTGAANALTPALERSRRWAMNRRLFFQPTHASSCVPDHGPRTARHRPRCRPQHLTPSVPADYSATITINVTRTDERADGAAGNVPRLGSFHGVEQSRGRWRTAPRCMTRPRLPGVRIEASNDDYGTVGLTMATAATWSQPANGQGGGSEHRDLSVRGFVREGARFP